ncbi:phage integrase central domain-containing protein [Natranaerobius thermophilus]|uniref:phage integrase central domain-containing protein n=1 Tax=Natranaerobius thermophilus TaxID=375929 RepID=UPI0001666BEE|nr:phage integrase N-terminal SAM-like domain-containing protein [Natranaerobius thermophilus]
MTKPAIDPEIANIIESLIKKKRRKWSDNTVRAVRTVLYNFFSDVRKKISEIEQDDVLKWLNKYKVDKAPKTVNQRLNIIKTFFKFAKKRIT